MSNFSTEVLMSESSGAVSAAGSSSITSSSSQSSNESINYEYTLKLQLPKFSRDYKPKDFIQSFIQYINRSDIKNIGRLGFPNEWVVTLGSLSPVYKLLKKGVVEVRNRKCVIFPFNESKICGRIHWLPADVSDSCILAILRRFGDVGFFEKEKVVDDTGEMESNVRFFVMTLKPNVTKETIPHFLRISQSDGLVTIKGRQPMCFGCKGEHRKVDCKLRKTNFIPKAILKKKRKKKPKSQEVDASANATDDSNTAPGSAAVCSPEIQQGRTQPNQSIAGASGNTPRSGAHAGPPNPFANIDTNKLEDLVNLIGQTLVGALNTAKESAGAATASAIGGEEEAKRAADEEAKKADEEAKKRGKKKKKNKKKDSYDVTTNNAAEPEAAINFMVKPVAIPVQVPVNVSVGVGPMVNTSASGDTSAQKKKKKKKKNKSSNTENL